MHLIRSIALSTIVASLGSTSLGFHQLIPQSTLQSVFPRQASDPCPPICDPANKALDTCEGERKCLCTASTAASLQPCITCLIANDSNSTEEVFYAEELTSLFNNRCANVTGAPSLTLPSRSASSRSASSTSPAQGTTAFVTTSHAQKSTIPTTTVYPTDSQAPSTPTSVVGSSIRTDSSATEVGALFVLVLGIMLVV